MSWFDKKEFTQVESDLIRFSLTVVISTFSNPYLSFKICFLISNKTNDATTVWVKHGRLNMSNLTEMSEQCYLSSIVNKKLTLTLYLITVNKNRRHMQPLHIESGGRERSCSFSDNIYFWEWIVKYR